MKVYIDEKECVLSASLAVLVRIGVGQISWSPKVANNNNYILKTKSGTRMAMLVMLLFHICKKKYHTSFVRSSYCLGRQSCSKNMAQFTVNHGQRYYVSKNTLESLFDQLVLRLSHLARFFDVVSCTVLDLLRACNPFRSSNRVINNLVKLTCHEQEYLPLIYCPNCSCKIFAVIFLYAFKYN